MAEPALPSATVKPATRKPAGPKPAARPKPFWQQAAGAFWHGFSEPSMLAFQVFCASLIATLAFCFWFFSDTTLAGPLGRYLPRSGLDAEGFATHEALRSGLYPPQRPRLFVLGTSTVAQALDTGTTLHDRILAGSGQDWEVVMLTTPLQSPVDQFALIERALASQTADSPPALVAVGLGVQRLRWTDDQTMKFVAQPRLGLRSDWADDEVRRLGGTPAQRSGVYVFDNLPFVLINGSKALIRLVTQTPARRLIAQYALGPAKPPDTKLRAMLGREIRAGIDREPAYFAQIRRLQQHVLRRPNTTLVMIEESLSPGLIDAQGLDDLQSGLAADFASAFRDPPLDFWQIVTEAQLTGSAYFDDLHILPGAAQDKVQSALADHVIAFIQAAGKAEHGT